jgi:hypothetical protein
VKAYSEQLDHRYYSILEEEFDLPSELERLRGSHKHELADALKQFMPALTAMPPRWGLAKKFGTEIADYAYGHERDFEHFRNAIIRALSPLMFDLPETMMEMLVALKHPESRPANALAAARIIRIFGVNDFDPH